MYTHKFPGSLLKTSLAPVGFLSKNELDRLVSSQMSCDEDIVINGLIDDV